MSTLSDDGIRKLAEYAKRLAVDSEIAALEAKYGTTPNAETIAAMKELDGGGGETVTMDELKAMLDEIS
jgi:cytochrome c553